MPAAGRTVAAEVVLISTFFNAPLVFISSHSQDTRIWIGFCMQVAKTLTYPGTCRFFYPRDAMLARVLAVVVCLSVRHTPVLCQNG